MQNKNFSEDTARLVDSEVKGIINEARTRCHDILQENIKYLHAIAEALLERETISGDDLELILNNKSLPPLDLVDSKPKAKKDDFIFDEDTDDKSLNEQENTDKGDVDIQKKDQ